MNIGDFIIVVLIGLVLAFMPGTIYNAIQVMVFGG